MKVLFISHVADLYGASRSLMRIASRLAQDGNQVEVILPEEGPLCPALRAAGVRVLVHPGLPVLRRRAMRLPFGPVRLFVRTLTSAFQIARHIRRSRPGRVHTNSAVIPSSALAARLSGVPHVWHMREFLHGESLLWPVYQWYMALLSNRILCIPEAVGRQFCASLRRRLVSVAGNGIPRGEASGAGPKSWRAVRRKLRPANRSSHASAGCRCGLFSKLQIHLP